MTRKINGKKSLVVLGKKWRQILKGATIVQPAMQSDPGFPVRLTPFLACVIETEQFYQKIISILIRKYGGRSSSNSGWVVNRGGGGDVSLKLTNPKKFNSQVICVHGSASNTFTTPTPTPLRLLKGPGNVLLCALLPLYPPT
jgi:hypothetical protein